MLFEFSFHLAQLKNVLFFCGLDRKHLRRWNGEGTTTPSKPTTTHWTYIMPIIYSSIEWTKPAFSVGWCAIRVIVLQKKSSGTNSDRKRFQFNFWTLYQEKSPKMIWFCRFNFCFNVTISSYSDDTYLYRMWIDNVGGGWDDFNHLPHWRLLNV